MFTGQCAVAGFRIATTDATPTELARIRIPPNSTMSLMSTVLVQRDTALGDCARWSELGLATRTPAGVTAIQNSIPFVFQDPGGLGYAPLPFTVDGVDVIQNAIGAPGDNVQWIASVVYEILGTAIP
jgi:hypothetical protein